MLLASSIGSIAHPFFIAFAWLIAFFYNLIPNYAIAIALLTLTVMVVVFPVTRRGTRSMMKMQLLSPELKRIQTRYKAPPGASVAEKQESRQKLNEEMMALYKENGVSPTGGCAPMLLQFPIFWILYGTIRGLTHEKTVGTGAAAHPILDPLYISHTSNLYKSIHSASPSVGLHAFGINLADSVRTTGLSGPGRLPYVALVIVAIALQYIQMRQLSGRQVSGQANPQMQQMQKFMPIIFGFVYLLTPAGVAVYFIVSGLFRIGQQEVMYRRDPHIKDAMGRSCGHARQSRTRRSSRHGFEPSRRTRRRVSSTGSSRPPPCRLPRRRQPPRRTARRTGTVRRRRLPRPRAAPPRAAVQSDRASPSRPVRRPRTEPGRPRTVRRRRRHL